ncbi:ABC transporter substrate-binding protein [Bacillus sp. M6-12]|uniref:transporter substrate-binding domain-containing protein n=1 Tax=Bacillus sp. M6-12 TaxID=2054166 RepID=UPI000C7595D0|nr:transporter substrate-binding domain-containing protein [Bacillus sp. M6-12]PLS18151.1 ABC transporter substrate-binding protein [Bacillus sp. M6-12]
MISIKSFTSIGLFLLLSIVLLTGCGSKQTEGDAQGSSENSKENSSEKKTLVMATSADYPPYEFHDQSNGKDEIVGMDIDIAKIIAEELGFNLEIKDMDFTGLLPALQTGRVDFVMAGMTPAEERKKNADFSIKYFETKNAVVAKKGSNITSAEDLKDKKVAVQLGSVQEKDVEEIAKEVSGIEMKRLNKNPEIIQELKVGRIDAAVIEGSTAKSFIQNNPDLEFNIIPKKEDKGIAIAFPKGSSHIEDFNKVIKELQDNGKIEELAAKWLSEKQ